MGYDPETEHMTVEPERRCDCGLCVARRFGRAAHPTARGLDILSDSIEAAISAKQTDLDACISFLEEQLADLDMIVNALDRDDLDRGRTHAAIVNLFDAFARGVRTANKLSQKLGPQSERLKSQAFRLSETDHV